jgi:hypothetical protein
VKIAKRKSAVYAFTNSPLGLWGTSGSAQRAQKSKPETWVAAPDFAKRDPVSLPRLAATFPDGAPLSAGQVQQLQWVLPAAFCDNLVAALRNHALAGAKLRFTHRGVEHWWGTFDAERMLAELLHQPAHSAFTRDALLPLAGCGRQQTRIYLVNVHDASVWHSEAGAAPAPLGLTLTEVLQTAVAEPRARARRRLPTKTRRPRVAHTEAQRRRAKSPAKPCNRTLMLFG